LKKKRRKAPGTREKVYASLVAGVLIAAALFFSLLMANTQGAEVDEAAIIEAPGLPPVAEAVDPVAPHRTPLPAPLPAPPETIPPVQVPPAQILPPVQVAPPIEVAPQITPLPAPLPAPPPVPDLPAAVLPSTLLPPELLLRDPPGSRGTLVFVIDDAGNNLHDLDPFLTLGIPLTIAVLPGLPHSVESARRIRAAGKEVFLHQPMEAISGMNPGPGAIMAGMDRDEIRAILTRNLDEVGPVAGFNNHMGSRITMDEEAMEVILTLSMEKGILFLDSRTTHESAAARTAKRLGMNIGERDIFLDNSPERESILRFIYMGLQAAEQRGSAIMIGHVQSSALAPLLSELIPELKDRGFSFSSASEIINRAGT